MHHFKNVWPRYLYATQYIHFLVSLHAFMILKRNCFKTRIIAGLCSTASFSTWLLSWANINYGQLPIFKGTRKLKVLENHFHHSWLSCGQNLQTPKFAKVFSMPERICYQWLELEHLSAHKSTITIWLNCPFHSCLKYNLKEHSWYYKTTLNQYHRASLFFTSLFVDLVAWSNNDHLNPVWKLLLKRIISGKNIWGAIL